MIIVNSVKGIVKYERKGLSNVQKYGKTSFYQIKEI